MTVLQFMFTLGLPSLSVLVGILLNQRGIDRLDHRIDRFEARIDKVESGLLELEKSWQSRLLKSEQDAERRNERVIDALGKIQQDMREFYRTLGQHEVRLSNLEKA